ncbi:P1 family peptidase [Kutzneria sp. NPDC052558]|uniref:P1 family peptidase n=1 Tax=Kutzneria sp. NPDC052558 TaxID=3364121 RepID=UPI0037CC4268
MSSGARALGIPFDGVPGPHNAITDVSGLEVGYVTLIEGHGALRLGHGPVRTGVTAIVPRGREHVGSSCAAGMHSFNGNGELTGAHWLAETGLLSTPVLITNTYGVGACHRGVVDWMNLRQSHRTPWDFPVVGETYDGYLNDVNGSHVTAEHAVRAIDNAVGGPVAEGSVGGGTGMNCYGFKGGSGTASRLVEFGGRTYTLGAFIQANFGRRRDLTIAGRPVGKRLLDDNPLEDWHLPPGAGSAIVVVATDAPLLPQQCAALARRVTIGLGRTGTYGTHSSGDVFLALSTANHGALDSTELSRLEFLPWSGIDGFFEATVQAVEEATVNSMAVNETMIGRDGHRSPALPHAALLDLL